ncbi:NAD-dependent epimerase/dehydratase family protein [Streptomyces tagetis]|uniref:NAD(P)-dependent oxidoreductase n=1 Tax=Streptomyces tagetis TaxID=2820809 RepID=A0A941B588_9ACTN|nr:NAD(P)-dependent oxidoreductase [Streptomyces sp. RG38]MBQ0825058.1 NAD(P)-dependent oxidoreductase [Streptomyces sp. RG38]
MVIVGRGFLAQSLEPLAERHPHVVAFTAGVSRGGGAAEAEFAREAALLYDALRDCRRTGRRLVYFSTSSAGLYGHAARSREAAEDGPVRPVSPYGRHKLAMEEVIRGSGADHLVLRLAYPVGRVQRPHQFLPSLVGQVRQGRVRIHRGARRDLIDARDAVALIDALLRLGVSRQVVNLASGWAVPVEDIVDHIERRFGTRAERRVTDVRPEGTVSTARLRRLLPSATRERGFGPDYYRRVIDTYLTHQEP